MGVVRDRLAGHRRRNSTNSSWRSVQRVIASGSGSSASPAACSPAVRMAVVVPGIVGGARVRVALAAGSGGDDTTTAAHAARVRAVTSHPRCSPPAVHRAAHLVERGVPREPAARIFASRAIATSSARSIRASCASSAARYASSSSVIVSSPAS